MKRARGGGEEAVQVLVERPVRIGGSPSLESLR